MLGRAITDSDAGRITKAQLLSIFQEAVDNGDILEEENSLYVVACVIPLIDEGVLRPSRHSVKFEERINAKARERIAELRREDAKKNEEA